MPVKLSEIKGLMIEKIQNYEDVSYGHNQAIDSQSEVCIGLHRELLIFKLMEFVLSNDLEIETLPQLADFLIASEHTMLTVKS